MTLERDFEKYMRRVLENGHDSRPQADFPPADTWQRVLAQAQPQSEEKHEMSSATISATENQRTPGDYPRVMGRPPSVRRGFSHCLNLAATIAIVATLAVGGWFAAMQLNSPQPEPRFAALGIQPEEAGNGVCDVESLSVDEAIRIMKDPMEYLSRDMPEDMEKPFQDNGLNGNYVSLGDRNNFTFLVSLIDIASTPVIEREFDELLPIAQEYMDCAVHGTNGQVYRLLDPVVVQSQLVLRLPVLIPEEEVRVHLTELFAESALSPDSSLQREVIGVPNEDPELSIYIASSHLLHNGGGYIVPMKWMDSNGAVIAEVDIYGNPLSGDLEQVDLPFNIVIANSNLDGNWYISGTYSPEYYSTEQD